jgi:hypothetical protein
MSQLHESLVTEARKWVGVKEATGHNDGVEVEKFQKAVDGKAQGESWCMAFVQFCLQQVEAAEQVRTNVFSSEHCLTVWNKTPVEHRSETPAAGYIVIWQHGDTTQGHTGIVTGVVNANTFSTIEGNTGSGAGVIRDGDGVYNRSRELTGAGTMKVVGFLNPFLTPTD